MDILALKKEFGRLHVIKLTESGREIVTRPITMREYVDVKSSINYGLISTFVDIEDICKELLAEVTLEVLPEKTEVGGNLAMVLAIAVLSSSGFGSIEVYKDEHPDIEEFAHHDRLRIAEANMSSFFAGSQFESDFKEMFSDEFNSAYIGYRELMSRQKMIDALRRSGLSEYEIAVIEGSMHAEESEKKRAFKKLHDMGINTAELRSGESTLEELTKDLYEAAGRKVPERARLDWEVESGGKVLKVLRQDDR